MGATTDLSLAAFDVPTLMTKAFELTHKMHGLGVDDRASLREQRDAIVREMQRRSDALERTLVTIEATERVMRGVDETLSGVMIEGPFKGEVTAAVAEAREALDMAMERTTTITCSLVKDQSLSDRIAAKAREVVKPIKDRAREVGRMTREGR